MRTKKAEEEIDCFINSKCFSSQSFIFPRNASHIRWLAVTRVFTPMAHKPKKQSITKSDRKEFLLGQCSEINVDRKLFISQLERHMFMSLF